MSECPNASWITLTFIPDSISLVVNVCLNVWQLKSGNKVSSSIVGFLFKTSQFASLINLLVPYLAFPDVVREQID